MKTITTLWTLAKYLPAAMQLLTLIRETVGDERVQEIIRAVQELLGKVSPPPPTAESGGTVPAVPLGQEQQRRFLRFMNRTKVAGSLTDQQVYEVCSSCNVRPYTDMA